MSSIPSLSIVTPCYNPPPQWLDWYLQQVKLIGRELKDQSIEFIIVNDGSTVEFSLKKIKKSIPPHVKIVSYERNQGKGFAVREGVKNALGRYIIYTDIDFPFGVFPILKIYNLLQNGHDLVAGNRTSDYFQRLPFCRKIISSVLKSINYCLFPKELMDTQAGIKGFRQSLKQVFLSTKTNSFVFEIEFLRKVVYSKKLKYTVITVTPHDKIQFSDFSWGQICKEVTNLTNILLTPEVAIPQSAELLITDYEMSQV